CHRRIDMRAVSRGFGYAWARDQAALRAGVTRACRHIIRIEEIRETVVERTIGRRELPQQELLEKPGDVSAMPLRRTGVGHGLDRLVLGRKRPGAPFGFIANRDERIAPEAAHIAERFGDRVLPSGSSMEASGRTWHQGGPGKT